MTRPKKPLLQLAVDVTRISAGLEVIARTLPNFDILEVGTPWIIENGMQAVVAARELCPNKLLLADTKIMDAGYVEASIAFRNLADIVTVLGVADDATIKGALKAAAESPGKGRVMADLINAPDAVSRARELEALGVHILCLHTAYDRQGRGIDPLAELRAVRPVVGCALAIAGGLTLDRVGQAVKEGADIIVAGGAILNAPDPGKAARQFMEAVKA